MQYKEDELFVCFFTSFTEDTNPVNCIFSSFHFHIYRFRHCYAESFSLLETTLGWCNRKEFGKCSQQWKYGKAYQRVLTVYMHGMENFIFLEGGWLLYERLSKIFGITMDRVNESL
jgi:hypothetical protein